MNIILTEYTQLAIILLISIGIHEYAHARTSDKLGDPTPKMMGRLTLNPFAHIDPLGFVMIFLVKFGRGKPVQINPSYYRHPLRDELMVALAGPLSNIILAFIGTSIVYRCNQTPILTLVPQLGTFRELFAIINCGMAVFNLMPLPSLDGRRLIKILIPHQAAILQHLSSQYMRITFGLLFIGIQIMRPIISGLSIGLYQLLHLIVFTLFML